MYTNYTHTVSTNIGKIAKKITPKYIDLLPPKVKKVRCLIHFTHIGLWVLFDRCSFVKNIRYPFDPEDDNNDTCYSHTCLPSGFSEAKELHMITTLKNFSSFKFVNFFMRA